MHARLKHDERLLPRAVDGERESTWIVADYLDVVLHVFTPDTRAYYRLEDLWGDVPRRARSRQRVVQNGHGPADALANLPTCSARTRLALLPRRRSSTKWFDRASAYSDRSWTSGTPYSDLRPRLLRVQCKTAVLRHEVVVVRCYSCRRSADETFEAGVHRRRSRRIRGILSSVAALLLLPIEWMRGRTVVELRIGRPTLNNQKSSARFYAALLIVQRGTESELNDRPRTHPFNRQQETASQRRTKCSERIDFGWSVRALHETLGAAPARVATDDHDLVMQDGGFALDSQAGPGADVENEVVSFAHPCAERKTPTPSSAAAA